MLRILLSRSRAVAGHISAVSSKKTSVLGASHSLFTSAINNYSIYKNDNDMPVEMTNPFEKEKQECILCKMNITPDYKNVKLLSQFVSPYTGQIYGRHITGLCRHKQFQVEREIKKSQRAGLMAIALKELIFMKDPKLFDPDRPFRPHKY